MSTAFDLYSTVIQAPYAETHPLYWSVRRELWENRSIYLVPLLVTGIVLFGTFISLLGLPHRMRTLPLHDPAKLHAAVVRPVTLAPAPIMLASFLVGLFYALDALYGERRDRSILFWKSLPVSDRITVVSKAVIPLVVLPLIALVLGLLAQWILLLLSSFVLTVTGSGVGTLWSEFRLFQEPMVMVYGLTIHSLWFAPIYCWLLLVSAWARRMPLLWAVFPPLAIAVLEKIAFSTTYFFSMLRYRITGAMAEGFVPHSGGVLDRVDQLDPGRFLIAPGLWVGLLFAAACLAAAARLRRNREPI